MAKFKASYKGIGEMLVSPWMQREMHNIANKARVIAEATAPVYEGDGPDETPGSFKVSFTASSGIQEHQTSRAYGRLESHDDPALWIEIGTKKTPAHHTMYNAMAEASGNTKKRFAKKRYKKRKKKAE